MNKKGAPKKAGVVEFNAGASPADYEAAAEALKSRGGRRDDGAHGGRFEKTHEAILRSAEELFARNGFKGATTRDIAAGAGVTEITLYRHFKSKEEIFFEIIKRMSVLSVAGELAKIAESGACIESVLEKVGLKFIEIFRKRSNEFRIMLSETITRPKLSKTFFEAVPNRGIELLAGIMQKGIAAGRLAKNDPRLLARAFIGMFLSYNLMQEIFLGKERENYDDAAVARFFTRIFLDGAVHK